MFVWTPPVLQAFSDRHFRFNCSLVSGLFNEPFFRLGPWWRSAR